MIIALKDQFGNNEYINTDHIIRFFDSTVNYSTGKVAVVKIVTVENMNDDDIPFYISYTYGTIKLTANSLYEYIKKEKKHERT